MTFVPKLLEKGFARYATFLAEHKIWFLLVPLLITAILGSGWSQFSMEDDVVKIFTPDGSEWEQDRLRFEKFFGLGNASMKYVLFSAKHPDLDNNLLSPNMSRAVLETASHMETKLTVNYNGTEYAYRPDMVMRNSPYYFPNRLIHAVMNERSTAEKPRQFSYPVYDVIGQRLFLPFAFGGIKLRPQSDTVDKVQAVIMRYAVRTNTTALEYVSDDFERQLFEFSEKPHHTLDLKVFSWKSLVDEVRKNTTYTLVYVPGTILLVLLFTVFVCTTFNIDTCMCVHAVCGLFSVVMSFVTGMGLMFYCGLKYNDLVSVVSFLALAIGVDDTFIMLLTWRRHRNIGDRFLRMQETLSEAGSSITFTSLTDVLAFTIGATIRLPALRDFCMFTAVAIACDFFYQVTFFPAAMLYCEELRDWAGYKWHRFAKSSFAKSRTESVLPIFDYVTDLKPRLMKNSKWTLEHILGEIVCHPASQCLILLITIALTGVATVGMSRMRPNASFRKLLVDDSPTHRYVDLFDQSFWQEAILFHFIVKSPDFGNWTDVEYFKDLMHTLEDTEHSVGGSKATSCWLHEFASYVEDWGVEKHEMKEELSAYIKPGPGSVALDVHTYQELQPNGKILTLPDEFHFTIGYRGIQDWRDRATFVQNISKIKEEFSRFQMSVFSEVIMMTDLLVYTDHAMKQTMGIVMLCTFTIVMFFLPFQRCSVIFWISTSFLSINASVLGFLSFWDTDIDVISMVTLLMSVGFSVDYTVHMAYMFSRQSDAEDADIKLAVRNSLDAVARPILYAGASTLIAVSLTALVKSYMIRVFLKTILLVVVLGLYQSLLVLPVLFVLVNKQRGKKCSFLRKT